MQNPKPSRKLKQTPLTRLRRAPKRGSFAEADIYAILDATPMCHVGYQLDNQPVVMPTCHWRVGDRLYWHGSRLSRTMQRSAEQQVCVTVTLLDGLVLTRSAFHHSANYRSALVFGEPEVVGGGAKLEALEHFIEGLFPGRWATLRPPSRKEMNATTVLSLPISQASAKVRQGPPVDLEDDLDLPIWAGVIPLQMETQAVQPCAHNQKHVPLPDHVSDYQFAGRVAASADPALE
ncbi:MAG: pyridoxamine 5'-phosphate oxidase family protein [Pseudomonadota bacterium]